MDSGNSGSVQSSSGGGGGDQDEFDSRTHTLAAFLNPTTATTSTTARFIPPTPLYNHHFHADLDHRWASTMRSDPSSSQTVRSDVVHRSPEIAAVTGNRIPPARNPKKRSRASRRAPTTVLTTDTMNFRAMVQEFTGIPSPPLSSSPFLRNRLDLFGASSGIRSSLLLPPMPYRPSPQKFQPPPPPQQEPFLSPPFATNNGASTSNSVTYQLPPPPTSGLCLSSMQNPIMAFQSLLQPPPKLADEFGSGQTQLSDLLPNLVSSEGAHHRPPRGNADQANWTDGGDRINENVRDINRGGGGGMVESWLCSTD